MFKLLGLLLVLDNKCQEVSGASELEFVICGILLDLDGLCLRLSRLDQEVLDFFDLLGHSGCVIRKLIGW